MLIQVFSSPGLKLMNDHVIIRYLESLARRDTPGSRDSESIFYRTDWNFSDI